MKSKKTKSNGEQPTAPTKLVLLCKLRATCAPVFPYLVDAGVERVLPVSVVHDAAGLALAQLESVVAAEIVTDLVG